MPHRFFVPANWITPPTVTLADDLARQIRLVLRLRPGDEIVALDNSGAEFTVTLTEVGRTVQGQITGRRPTRAEPGLRLTLYQGTLKADKFEWVLQKGTELGVARFVPTLCQRSVVRDRTALAKKESRWAQIIREAAEQSGRGRLPELAPPHSLAEALAAAASHQLTLMPWEEAGQPPLKQVLAGHNPADIGLFIGPEGGFAPAEAEQARAAGAVPVSLGPRILRAETAALAACAVLLYHFDEWDNRDQESGVRS